MAPNSGSTFLACFESAPKVATGPARPSLTLADTRLWTHYDITDNLLCHVTGTKRVLLFPPEVRCLPARPPAPAQDVANLYVRSSSSPAIVSEAFSADNPFPFSEADLLRFPRLAQVLRTRCVADPCCSQGLVSSTYCLATYYSCRRCVGCARVSISMCGQGSIMSQHSTLRFPSTSSSGIYPTAFSAKLAPAEAKRLLSQDKDLYANRDLILGQQVMPVCLQRICAQACDLAMEARKAISELPQYYQEFYTKKAAMLLSENE